MNIEARPPPQHARTQNIIKRKRTDDDLKACGNYIVRKQTFLAFHLVINKKALIVSGWFVALLAITTRHNGKVRAIGELCDFTIHNCLYLIEAVGNVPMYLLLLLLLFFVDFF